MSHRELVPARHRAYEAVAVAATLALNLLSLAGAALARIRGRRQRVYR